MKHFHAPKYSFRLFLFFLPFFIVVSSLGCEKKESISQHEIHSSDEERIAQAYAKKQSNLWVQASGIVERILADDLEGSRHQRFIVRMSNAQTLLISHNIDLAERVKNLKAGERVYFRGEYEYNDKGGVIHWTHHDPQRRIHGGWIEYQGKRYR